MNSTKQSTKIVFQWKQKNKLKPSNKVTPQVPPPHHVFARVKVCNIWQTYTNNTTPPITKKGFFFEAHQSWQWWTCTRNDVYCNSSQISPMPSAKLTLLGSVTVLSHGQKTRAWLSIPIGSMGREYLPTFTISSIHVGKYSSPMDPKRDWILVVSLSGSQNVKVYEIIPIPVSSELVCKNWCRNSPFRKPTFFWGAEIV